MNVIEPKSEESEGRRTYMKDIEDEIEIDIAQKEKKINGQLQINERIKKNGRKQGRYYTNGKPQLTKTCGQFNLKPRRGKRKKKL